MRPSLRNGFLIALLCLSLESVFARKPEMYVPRGHSRAVKAVAFSPDGRISASITWDTTTKLWDIKTGKRIDTIKTPVPVNSIAISLAQKKTAKAKHTYTSQSEVAAAVKKIIVEELKVDEKKVLPTARIVEDLGADDLDQVEIIMNCEDEFGIEIPDDDAQKLKRVGDISSYVWTHLKHA